MTLPYRVMAAIPVPAPWRLQRTWKGLWRSFWRRVTVWQGGPFLERFPVRCPCGKRSWDPEAVRRFYDIPGVGRMNARLFSLQANQWRCGERHGLQGNMQLG